MPLPLVGRQDDLAEAQRLVASGVGALLSGPAGIGKTRLLQALAEQGPADLERVTGTDATAAVPLGALVRFLPTPLDPPPGPDVLSALRAALLALAERGTVLAVDDADRLDPVSTALLADSARAGLVLVLTSRAVAGLAPPLLALLDEGLLVPLALGPLLETDAACLVRAVMGSGTPAPTVRRVVDLGEGNPLLLSELARAGLQPGLEELPLTERLRLALGERLSALPLPAARLLELLAYDAPLPLPVLVAVEGETAVDELERAGLLAVGPGPEHLATVAHPLMTEAVRERLTAVRRSTLARALLRAVDGHPSAARAGVPDGTVRHARWQVDAGEVCAPLLLREAAVELLSRCDPQGAGRLAALALRELPGDPGCRLVLAGAAAHAGRHEEAETRYAELLAQPGLSSEQRLQAVLGQAETAWFGRGDEAAASAVLQDAGAALPGAAAPVAALAALIALVAGRPAQAAAAASRVLPTAPTDLRLLAASVEHVAQASAGCLQEAWRTTERALSLLEQPGVAPEHRYRLAAGRQYLRLHLGELDDLRTQAHAPASADRLRSVASDCALGAGEVLAGRGDLARAHLDRAGARLDRSDPYGHSTFLACTRAELAALQGRRREAVRAADEAAAGHRRHLGWWAWTVPVAQGWAAVAEGRTQQGRAEMRRAAEVAASHGDLLHRCCALLAALRLGDPHVAAELSELAVRVDGRLWPAVTVAASALADGTDAAGRLEDGCRSLLDVGAVLWAVELLARGAQLDRASGAPDRVRRATRRLVTVERWAPHLVRVRPPALLDVRTGPDAVLTDRQRQVALLAADGVSSREIGEHLRISPRTVENHLARSYLALGVSSRRELAAVLLTVDDQC